MTRCASNLREIGTAILMYSNAERAGAFPRTQFDPKNTATLSAFTGVNAPNPFGPGGPAPNDVTTPLFLLARTQALDPWTFVCPFTSATAWNYGGATAASASNFPDRLALSYSYANPYPSPYASKSGYNLAQGMAPDFAIVADLNPGNDGQGNDVSAVRLTSSPRKMRAGNSLNHHRDGQCVLYTDGHVELQTNPFVGVSRDNIYTVSDEPPVLYTSNVIVGSPAHANDSVLLPTAQSGPTPAYDPSPPVPPPPMFTATELLVAALIGAAIAAILIPIIVMFIVRSVRKRRRAQPSA